MRGDAKMRKAYVVGAAVLVLAAAWALTPWLSDDSPSTDEAADAGTRNRAEVRRERELYVQECMAESGFEYVPQLTDDREPSVGVPAMGDDDLRTDGYGLATSLAAETDDGPDTGPNDEYYLDLDERHRDAYDAAMYGPGVHHGDQYDEGAFGDPDDPGCQAEAREQVEGPDPGSETGGAEERVQAMSDRIVSDPELAALNSAWSDCMAEDGYDVDTLTHAPELVQERLAEAERPGGPSTEGPEEDPGSVMIEAPDPAEAYDPDQLEEVRGFELELAGRDADCRDEVDFEDGYRARLDEIAEDL